MKNKFEDSSFLKAVGKELGDTPETEGGGNAHSEQAPHPEDVITKLFSERELEILDALPPNEKWNLIKALQDSSEDAGSGSQKEEITDQKEGVPGEEENEGVEDYQGEGETTEKKEEPVSFDSLSLEERINLANELRNDGIEDANEGNLNEAVGEKFDSLEEGLRKELENLKNIGRELHEIRRETSVKSAEYQFLPNAPIRGIEIYGTLDVLTERFPLQRDDEDRIHFSGNFIDWAERDTERFLKLGDSVSGEKRKEMFERAAGSLASALARLEILANADFSKFSPESVEQLKMLLKKREELKKSKEEIYQRDPESYEHFVGRAVNAFAPERLEEEEESDYPLDYPFATHSLVGYRGNSAWLNFGMSRAFRKIVGLGREKDIRLVIDRISSAQSTITTPNRSANAKFNRDFFERMLLRQITGKAKEEV